MCSLIQKVLKKTLLKYKINMIDHTPLQELQKKCGTQNSMVLANKRKMSQGNAIKISVVNQINTVSYLWKRNEQSTTEKM